jgi:hypothetical protein
MAWAKNGTPNTLVSAGDDMDITDLTAKKFNQFLCHNLATGGTTRTNWTFDNNGNTDYAFRKSEDGGADSTATSQTNILDGRNWAGDDFNIIYSSNIDSEEKLNIHFVIHQVATGASQAPSRMELVGKCDTTTNSGQYTRVDCNNNGAGDYDTGSNLTAIGTD